jgi:hypothetical protein
VHPTGVSLRFTPAADFIIMEMVIIKNPVKAVWLRLTAVLLVFFSLSMTLGSQPIRGNTVDGGELLLRSIEFVIKGPAILVYWQWEPLGILVTIGFWAALLATATRSSRVRKRRWFYVLLILYIVMTSIGLFGEIVMGIIAMSHAL